MCSYHNCNQLNLSADPALQRSLRLALRSRGEHDARRDSHEDVDEDDRSADSDDEEGDAEEHNTLHGDLVASCFPKRMKNGVSHGDVVSGNHPRPQNCIRTLQPQGLSIDINRVFSEGSKSRPIQQQWVNSLSASIRGEEIANSSSNAGA
ncbi:hypothetical protein MUK42_36113 [Musa troglodytarum]|uniref:Uncharacterized protein n=1 Tax=Musa troglodytarum TaxID=320322 RepID=A0A9E7EFN8_9LILI|nr:hypothetical protein MUK42_36113 [Musa troglodytarum]